MKIFPLLLLPLLPLVLRGQDRPIVIKAGTVLDGKGGVLRNVGIVIEGSKITRIDPGVREATYDLSRQTVMPGWIDTHVHIGNHFDPDGRNHNSAAETPQQAMAYAVENASLMLNTGFTTVQSLGAELDGDLRDRIHRGAIPGPRLLTSLRQINENTGTPDQIRQFVRKAKADGADVVKLFASKSIREGGTQSMTDEQILAACGEARAVGLRSVVHAQDDRSARAAALAGCTSIEHGSRLPDEVLRLMADRGTYLDPHFGLLYANYLENRDKFFGTRNFDVQAFANMEKIVPVARASFKRALAAGSVKIIFGTDAVAGSIGRNHEEFVYRVRDGGQSPMDAIISATSRAAASLDLANRIGTIAPDFEADLIAVDGDPLQDITVVRRVMFVMKGGKVYKNVGR